jgi:hypothetical protein
MKIALPMALALALAAAAEEPAPGSPDAGTAAPAEKKSAEQVRAVVHMRDGGVVRGTVKRMRLGKSITLALQSGKSITVDDQDIVDIQLFGGAAPADAGKEPPNAFAEQSVTAASPKGAPAKPGDAARPMPLPLPAATSDLDTVYLTNGGLLRGTVESEKPELVLRLVSGRKRTIAPADVKSVTRHGAPAAAEATTLDAVYLKDGSVVRGTVEAEKPDVVVRLVSGKKRTFPGASVQRVDRARKP